MIALNETVLRLGLQKDIDQYHEAEQQLARDLENYLKDNGK